MRPVRAQTSVDYAKGLGRAFVGASLFALPLFMTMEMWRMSALVDPLRICALLLVTLPALVALSHFAGFEPTFGIVDNLLDAFAALGVAGLSATIILALTGVLTPDQPPSQLIGTIAVVSFPGAIGALLADKQLGASDDDRREHGGGYLARLFLMTIGAVFVALNVAPTEEIVLIAYQISPAQAALLACASLLMLHALLFWVDFPGREARRGERSHWSTFVRLSLTGYALCLLSSAFLLWAFGRTDGVAFDELLEFIVVLSFPAALGAGLAHMVVGANDA